MKQHYNIALLPEVYSLNQYLIELAQLNFIEYQDGYILSNNAIPHITLCQFACSKEVLLPIWQLIKKELSSNYFIKFDGFYLNAECNKPEEFMLWTGLSVRREESIINLQARIHTLLSDNECQVFTSCSESYFPHLTFSRLRYRQVIKILKYPDTAIFTDIHRFIGSLGVSDELGAYKKIMYQLVLPPKV